MAAAAREAGQSCATESRWPIGPSSRSGARSPDFCFMWRSPANVCFPPKVASVAPKDMSVGESCDVAPAVAHLDQSNACQLVHFLTEKRAPERFVESPSTVILAQHPQAHGLAAGAEQTLRHHAHQALSYALTLRCLQHINGADLGVETLRPQILISLGAARCEANDPTVHLRHENGRLVCVVRAGQDRAPHVRACFHRKTIENFIRKDTPVGLLPRGDVNRANRVGVADISLADAQRIHRYDPSREVSAFRPLRTLAVWRAVDVEVDFESTRADCAQRLTFNHEPHVADVEE